NTQINQSFQLSPTQTLTVQPTTVIDETASWLTYTSDDLKITFKYPPNLQVESSKNEVKIFNSNTKNTPEYSFIEYVLYGNTTNQSIEDYVKKKENISSLKFSNLLVGGFEAKRTIEIPKSDINDSIFIKKGYEIYKFDLNNAGDAGSISSENFEKILSTFKFLD
ncbi:hypothetical protein HY358_01345, partial [Candidatus Roizmanbacteria bacterium]|nr:hypothetical protein [Candidatus Roizmanbacteria bacterium]